LAVDRFPVANEDGTLIYDRTFGVPTNVADRLERFAVVQHGVDLNGNGVYDEEAAGVQSHGSGLAPPSYIIQGLARYSLQSKPPFGYQVHSDSYHKCR